MHNTDSEYISITSRSPGAAARPAGPGLVQAKFSTSNDMITVACGAPPARRPVNQILQPQPAPRPGPAGVRGEWHSLTRSASGGALRLVRPRLGQSGRTAAADSDR